MCCLHLLNQYELFLHISDCARDLESQRLTPDARELRNCTITAPGSLHTLVWTDAGELFSCGDGRVWQLGHGVNNNEQVPRLVEALAGQTVVGAMVSNSIGKLLERLL